ncbi:hypothetical protein QN277_003821 [Acacia crassicarpa]|uniref:Uncharacterized protein n=1 Tax=Acacia crassicarpa TaxID=499986 RepID=A0AAE1J2E0_9FABA|nr:hypothetical protein QN277_003821 [Acacia crassicarpa]
MKKLNKNDRKHCSTMHLDEYDLRMPHLLYDHHNMIFQRSWRKKKGMWTGVKMEDRCFPTSSDFLAQLEEGERNRTSAKKEDGRLARRWKTEDECFRTSSDFPAQLEVEERDSDWKLIAHHRPCF